MKYFFSFRSRNAALRFRDDLGRNGIPSMLRNTPQEAGVGCGLSVCVAEADLHVATRVLGIFPSAYYAGTFAVDGNGYVAGRV